MGLLDSLVRLGRGSGRGAQPVTLLEGEVEVLRSVAGLRPGRLDSVGGDLVLTNRRVIFTPLDVRDLSAVLKWGLGKSGGAAANPLVDQAVTLTGDVVDVGGGLEGVALVRAGSDSSLTKPPTLILTGKDGTATELGILHSRMTASNSAKNKVARDQMVAAIQKQLA